MTAFVFNYNLLFFDSIHDSSQTLFFKYQLIEWKNTLSSLKETIADVETHVSSCKMFLVDTRHNEQIVIKFPLSQIIQTYYREILIIN